MKGDWLASTLENSTGIFRRSDYFTAGVNLRQVAAHLHALGGFLNRVRHECCGFEICRDGLTTLHLSNSSRQAS